MNNKVENVGACVFDAYGTLFDVNAAAAHCKDEIGEQWEALANIWRMKQLNYTWLRSLMDEYVDFWQVTGDALDYAMDSLDMDDDALRDQLMKLYEQLDAYGEVPGMLKTLKGRGITTAILSNGTKQMLESAAGNAGIDGDLDVMISVDELEIYKPHPSVYQLAVDQLGFPAERICFMSSNAWDVAGAANFGFQVVWINRFGQKPERLPGEYVAELSSLEDLPDLV
jgi:2-haloacid dehalogenase